MFQKFLFPRTFAISLFALLFSVLPVCAAPGDLDTTFGSGGKVITAVTPRDEFVRNVRIQPDGKIVTLGDVIDLNGSRTDSFIVRHNADGSLDTGFGINGSIVLPNNSANEFEIFNDFVIQADGKILAIGRKGIPRLVTLFRYNANGARDTTFGTNGVITTQVGNSATGLKIAIEPDGKIVVAGFTVTLQGALDKVAVVRYGANGMLDTNFGIGGSVITTIGTRLFNVTGLLIQTDGKITVAGTSQFSSSNEDYFLARYNADGTLDAGFGTSGIFSADIGSLINLLTNAALQPDGKIVFNGLNFNSAFQIVSSSIVRLNPNGTFDSGFGTNGIITISEPTPFDLIGSALALQQNGKILTAGSRDGKFAISRYNTNGTIDNSFGTNGVVTTAVGGNPDDDFISALAVQPDGKIVAAGSTSDADNILDVALVRYLGDAVIQKPSDFDGDGISDLGVFRPSNGTWYTSRSMQSFYAAQFGQSTDQPAPADYDGDGRTDIAVWRENVNGSFGYFYILQSSTNTVRIAQFGQTGDDPRGVGDWDGDGKADPAVYRAAQTTGGQSFFYYRPSAQPGVNFVLIRWGTNGDEAVRGDFDGDGKMNAAVFRPGNQNWYIRNSSNGDAQVVTFGATTDKRVPGDFDGDGKTDIAVFRPDSGSWYILQSASNQILYVQFGLGTDMLVPADYDGDGKTDIAVFRNGVWYIRQSTGGIRYALFGSSGDVPIASVFVQ
jgi:uncharacterized delta-60 repeat protein